MKKRLVAFLLVLIMVLGMLPVSAFAADDGVSPQALESNETQTIKYQILYVGDEFNIGYNYGVSVNKTYTCQYSTGHSGFHSFDSDQRVQKCRRSCAERPAGFWL